MNYIEYKSNDGRNKTLSIKRYLDGIKPYKKDIINNLKKPDTRKFNQQMSIDFISSKDTDKESVIHSKSDNTEFIISDNTDKVINEPFESLLKRYKTGLETSTTVSDSIFDCVHLLYQKCLIINTNGGESYIDSPDWIKGQKTTTKSINIYDNKYFLYAATLALNQKEIRKNSERMTKINLP